MKITILTMFPDFFESFLKLPVTRRVIEKGEAEVEVVDIKTFAPGSFRNIDDSPYGGGPGMILRCQPVLDALSAVKGEKTHTVLLSPKGGVYDQKRAREFSEKEHIVLICGHYEGVDARVERYVDEQLSIGDYVLTGGELAAVVIADSILRLLKGALREGSAQDESHENGLLEYPQYTRPAVYNGDAVPDVLLSGNQKAIDEWRLTQSLLLTREHRPDLFAAYPLTEKEKKLLRQADEKKR